MNQRTSGSKASNIARYVFGAVIAVALMPGIASACSIAAWTGTNTADAADAVEGMRYQGLCGLMADISDDADADTASDYVEERTAFNAEVAVKAIFYVNVDDATLGATDRVVIYQLIDTSDASQLDVAVLDGQVVLGTETAGAALNTGWNSVQVDWEESGAASVSVDNGSSDPTTASITTAGTGPVDGVRVGYIEGGGTGSMKIDSFVANRTTSPARLLNCDANNDAGVNSGDIVGVINEFLSPAASKILATGTPDCNEDGAINSGDIVGIINTFLAP